jgi:hypothetical protein
MVITSWALEKGSCITYATVCRRLVLSIVHDVKFLEFFYILIRRHTVVAPESKSPDIKYRSLYFTTNFKEKSLLLLHQSKKALILMQGHNKCRQERSIATNCSAI